VSDKPYVFGYMWGLGGATPAVGVVNEDNTVSVVDLAEAHRRGLLPVTATRERIEERIGKGASLLQAMDLRAWEREKSEDAK